MGKEAEVLQVRFHGRGGQGVVTAAELLADAAFRQGRHAQAFPSFGSERTGAPVVSFCRISERPIRVREPVLAPDALVIQDATLLQSIDVFAGLQPDGYALLNSRHTFAELGAADGVARLAPGRARTVAATEIALEHLGRPLPNAVLLGAFAALYPPLELAAVIEALRARFGGAVAEQNVAAAAAAHRAVSDRAVSESALSEESARA